MSKMEKKFHSKICLVAVLKLPQTRNANNIAVADNTIVIKVIFTRSIKERICFFNSLLNLYKFMVNKIWADNSKRINKIIINLLILSNNFESKSSPNKDACIIKNTQDNTPK